MHRWIWHAKTFVGGSNDLKFTIFSLKSFPLYGIVQCCACTLCMYVLKMCNCVYMYCTSLIKRPGVYLLTEFFDPALNRGRHLMFIFFARAKPQLVLVDETICINSRMASQGSVSEDRHEEASVIRGHHVYKSETRSL